MAQMFSDDDQERYGAPGVVCSLINLVYPDALPEQVRDSLIALLYDDKPGDLQRPVRLMVERCWDANVEDAVLDRLKNSKNDMLCDNLIRNVASKKPAWFDRLMLYYTVFKGSRQFSAIGSLVADSPSPMFIGPLLDHLRYGHPIGIGDFSAFAAVANVVGEEAAGAKGINELSQGNEFICKWNTAVFSAGGTPSDEVKKQAETLFKQLDSEKPAERTAAKSALIDMGRDILPLLEQQRDNDSPEVRSAVGAITDAIVAPGYSKIADLVKANQYDRNLPMFIGYLACLNPASRAAAAGSLKALTGQDFGADFAKWYNWYQANKDKLKWNDDKRMFVLP